MSEHGDALKAYRLKLESALLEAEPKEMAAIARELRQLWKEIESLPNEDELSKEDELARARDNRRKKASGE